MYSNVAKKNYFFTLQEKYDKAADDATECKNQPLYFNYYSLNILVKFSTMILNIRCCILLKRAYAFLGDRHVPVLNLFLRFFVLVF